jgi:hypothetical protein
MVYYNMMSFSFNDVLLKQYVSFCEEGDLTKCGFNFVFFLSQTLLFILMNASIVIQILYVFYVFYWLLLHFSFWFLHQNDHL